MKIAFGFLYHLFYDFCCFHLLSPHVIRFADRSANSIAFMNYLQNMFQFLCSYLSRRRTWPRTAKGQG